MTCDNDPGVTLSPPGTIFYVANQRGYYTVAKYPNTCIPLKTRVNTVNYLLIHGQTDAQSTDL